MHFCPIRIVAEQSSLADFSYETRYLAAKLSFTLPRPSSRALERCVLRSIALLISHRREKVSGRNMRKSLFIVEALLDRRALADRFETMALNVGLPATAVNGLQTLYTVLKTSSVLFFDAEAAAIAAALCCADWRTSFVEAKRKAKLASPCRACDLTLALTHVSQRALYASFARKFPEPGVYERNDGVRVCTTDRGFTKALTPSSAFIVPHRLDVAAWNDLFHNDYRSGSTIVSLRETIAASSVQGFYSKTNPNETRRVAYDVFFTKPYAKTACS